MKNRNQTVREKVYKNYFCFYSIMATRNFFLSTFFVSEEDLITKILKDFLTVNDFCNLDTSMCNHEHRDNFLKYSVRYCFDGSESIPLGDTFLTWAWRRHVSVRKLYLRLDSKFSSSILQYLYQNYSWNLTFLTTISVKSRTPMSLRD
jgi:hypothetical protein